MENERPVAKPTGRKYDSVDSLMAGEGVSSDVQKKVAELRNETRIVLQLAKLRQKAGITQEQLAEKLETSQSAISKLEAGRDEDLTLRDIAGYAQITGLRLTVRFGKPITHVEAVKFHALSIREHLRALAKIANKNEELEKEIQAFFGEAFFNILAILSECNDELPSGAGDFDIRVEVDPLAGFASTPLRDKPTAMLA